MADEMMKTVVSGYVESQGDSGGERDKEGEKNESAVMMVKVDEAKDKRRDDHMIEKMEAHLGFMEKEIVKSLAWQKELLSSYKANCPGHTTSTKAQNITLDLEPHEQDNLKDVLAHWLQISPSFLSLAQMLKLAARFQPPTHSSALSSPSHPRFPSFQRVVTLQDISSSPHYPPHPSSRSSAELSLARSPLSSQEQTASYYSPQPPRPHKRNPNVSNSIEKGLFSQQEDIIGDSLGKRLSFDESSLVTFREEEKMSLELSKSNSDQQQSSHQDLPQQPIQQNCSIKLAVEPECAISGLSQVDPRVCLPLIDLEVPLPQSRQSMTPRVSFEEATIQSPEPPSETREKYQEKEFLCFRQLRRRKSFKSRVQHNLQMKDSFGKAYEEMVFGRVKAESKSHLKPPPDRQTRQSSSFD